MEIPLKPSRKISIHALLAESDAVACGCMMDAVLFLSTLSLRRATMPALSRRYSTTISIHALLAESDPLKNAITAVPQQISIHALLAESDLRPCFSRSFLSNFYPRSPCGERPYGRINDISRLIFLSTLSLRRATAEAANNRAEQQISIHALLAESDRKGLAIRWNTCISIHALLAESDHS